MKRKGMGKGQGKGYKNMVGVDAKVHSQSAKGIKQPQKISPLVKHRINKDTILTEQKIEKNGKTEVKLMLTKQPPLMTAREIFMKKFGKNKPNVMTPNIERYGKLSRNVAFELSSGESLLDRNKRMYGVTIVKINPDGTTTSLFDHSKAFDSRKDAERYIKDLKKSKDSDKDGIPDKYDCDSTNPLKQDDESVVEIDDYLAGLEERDNGDNNMGFKERVKSVGKKIGEGVGKGIEFTKQRVAEQKEKAKQKRTEIRKAELKELKRPEARKLEEQQKRVDELRFQKEATDDEERKQEIEKELIEEEFQLNQKIEEVTEITLEDYSDAELKRLAVRYKQPDGLLSGLFGNPENPYKKELLRRTQFNKDLNQELKNIQSGKKKPEEKGLFDDLFDF